MTTKIIAENILEDSKFLSATEQAGEYWQQPILNSSNTGAMRPFTHETPQDFEYSGTATSDGTTTTIIDSHLSIFGDDYLIGATIEFTGGENTSGTKTVTDFTQSTGTLAWSGAVNATKTGDTFDVTLSFATRDFIVELISSGDTKDATHKWSHDGGSHYLGRDDPNQATWLGRQEIIAAGLDCTNSYVTGVQADNGDIVIAYEENTGGVVKIQKSSDNGLTWAAAVTVISSSVVFSRMFKTRSGRIAFAVGTGMAYSDDDGDTWSIATMDYTGIGGPQYIELSSGSLMAVGRAIGGDNSGDIIGIFSNDFGSTWSEQVVIFDVSVDKDSFYANVCETANGNIIAAYESEEDTDDNWEIKCKISTDGGATWGSEIDVMDYNTKDLRYPCLLLDITGRVYCSASRATDEDIVLAYSDNDGESWNKTTYIDLYSDGALSAQGRQSLFMVDGHIIICCYGEASTDSGFYMVRRGIWEAYASNACVCPPNAQEQHLVCGIRITWYGGAGAVGDSWTMETGFYYGAKNIISDSPSKPWKSTQDNTECNIVIDMGVNEKFYANGIAFFGCNMRTLSFQMNATDSWGAPSVDESISFDVTDAGVVDSASLNHIIDAALLTSFKDHQLKGQGNKKYFMRFTSGSHINTTVGILDNVGSYILIDTPLLNIQTDDTFVIFQSCISKTFTGGIYRYMRISIPAQQTADNYYKIGVMVAGRAIALSREWGIGYNRNNVYDIDMLATKGGGILPIKNADRKYTFSLPWKASKDTREEVLATIDYLEGKNLALIPDSSTLTDCYLVKSTGDIKQKYRFPDERFDFTITLEEVL